jgi:uncharacterized membrane protein
MKIILYLLLSLISGSSSQSLTCLSVNISTKASFSLISEERLSNPPQTKKKRKKKLKKRQNKLKLKNKKRKKDSIKTYSIRLARTYIIMGIITLILVAACIIIGIVLQFGVAVFLVAALIGLWGIYCIISGISTAKKAGGFKNEKNEKPVEKPSIRHLEEF